MSGGARSVIDETAVVAVMGPAGGRKAKSVPSHIQERTEGE